MKELFNIMGSGSLMFLIIVSILSRCNTKEQEPTIAGTYMLEDSVVEVIDGQFRDYTYSPAAYTYVYVFTDDGKVNVYDPEGLFLEGVYYYDGEIMTVNFPYGDIEFRVVLVEQSSMTLHRLRFLHNYIIEKYIRV